MKENIEETVEILEHIKEYMQKNIDDGINKFIYNEQGFDEKCIDIINAINEILSDNKRVLKENEELKAENNKLKVIKYDTNYGTETINLIPKSELVKINTNRYMIEIENGKFVDLKQVYQENEELKEKWDKDTHKLQNDLDIANAKIIELKQELMEGLYANRK